MQSIKAMQHSTAKLLQGSGVAGVGASCVMASAGPLSWGLTKGAQLAVDHAKERHRNYMELLGTCC